jgi:hypothetical protein
MRRARRSIFERHPAATLLIVTTLALGAIDVAFTHVYAVFRPQFYREHSTFRVPNAVYHHGFTPNASVDREYWGPLAAAYRTNSLGFRDRIVRDVPLQSDKRRILFIGDSFTEGIGIDYEKTFVGLVDAALAPRGVEVLNAGAASYAPIIDYRRTRHLLEDVGLRFDELIVFIDIGDIQDETTYTLDAAGNVEFKSNRWVNENRANWEFGKPRWLASQRLRNVLRKHTLAASTAYESLMAALSKGPRRAAAWTTDDGVFEEYGRLGLEKAQEHMDQLADLAASHGVRLTVAVYPWPDQIVMHDIPSKQQTVWREWSQRRGAGFIDCFPSFMQAGAAQDVVRREFIGGDIHWNEAGHRRVADVVLAYLALRHEPPVARGPRTIR